MAPRLSIVVLPFTNLSDDRQQQYFADGITEDLATDLSRIVGMFVISRSTAFTYKDKRVNAKQIGRDLNVRYVLQGSVRRSGSQVRVNAQLIDTGTDAHLWAERFDHDTSDLLALQNDITTRIAVALNLELIAAEAARRTERPDVLEYILRARAAAAKPPTRSSLAERVSWLDRALTLDQQSTEAQSWLAASLAARVMDNMTDTPAIDIARAEDLAEQALAAAPHSGLAHHAKAQVLRAQRRYAEAVSEYEMALASNRNWVLVLYALGQCKLHTGSMDQAIPLVEQAIRLSPRDPLIGLFYQQVGLVHLLQSRTEAAVSWLEKARNTAPELPYVHAWLASAYGLNGETERAVAELAEARRLSRDDRFSSIARLRALGPYRVLAPKIGALFEATLVGLRKAGMPEE